MDKIKIKINGYDEISQSLLVSFASDKTKNDDPSAYPVFAFQPHTMWPEVSIEDVEEIKKRIAIAGIHHAHVQEVEESFVDDARRSKILKGMVGSVEEFNIAELTAVNYETPFQSV